MKRRTFLLASAVLAAGLGQVSAQGFPLSKPVTLVVPFAPGGGTDAIARSLAELMRAKFGQPVIVENKGGAGGAIAAQFMKNAAPDGHTLMLATSTFVTSAAVRKAPPYDVINDFSPIAMLGSGPLVIVVNKDIGIDTLPQFLERLKAKPGDLNYVSSGEGSVTHLAGELFLQHTGTKMTHLPYRGSGPAVQDLLGGSGQAFFATVPTILGQIKGKNVKLLAVTSREKSPQFPDTPTVASFGIDGYDVGTWWGIIGPPKMPSALIAALNAAMNEIAGHASIQKRFEDEGAKSFVGQPKDFAAALEGEYRAWKRVVEIGGIKVD